MSSPETKPQASTEAGIVKRKRPAACIHCHQRKVRCDARTVGLPCSNCRSAGKEDCRIHEKKKRAAVRSVQHPVPIRCAPLPNQRRPSNLPSSNISPTNPSLQSPSPKHAARPSFSESSTRLPTQQTYTEAESPETHADEEDARELERHLVKLIDEEDSDRQRAIKKGIRVFYVGQDVSNLNFLFRQQHSDQNDEVYHFPTNEISRRYLRNGLEQIPREAFVLPDQALADELVDAYFTHVNPGCPVIDEDMFMAQYKGRDPDDAPSILLLQAILLVGAHVSRPRSVREPLKAAIFRRARILFEARVERNRDLLVQAALLFTWYSDPVDDDVAANAHFWVGVAARIATGLGMHRNATHSRMVPHDKRMWRRVWWILVQFDVMVSLMHGRPQAINLEDCDVHTLTPADFEGCGKHVQIDYVIHYTELCTMVSFIMRERFGLRVSAERRKAVLGEADKALANWSLKLPDSVRMSTADMDSWRAMLHLTYYNFLILLHRPHPRASAFTDDYGPNDAEICSVAAGVIVSIFEDLRERDRIKYVWISAVNALFTAMIQVRVELRFSNPVLAISGLRRFDSTMASLRLLAGYWFNAETVLRLFESSKRLQHDIQAVKSREPNSDHKDGSNQQRGVGHATPPDEHPAQPFPNVWPAGFHYDDRVKLTDRTGQRSTLDDLAQAAQSDQLGDQQDWRQLFTFADSEHQAGPIVTENFPDMEDEWRELYLHEPGISDYFTDGAWMQS